jgi:hypothetical protein
MAALEASLAAVRSDDEEKPAPAKKPSEAKGRKAPTPKRSKAKA